MAINTAGYQVSVMPSFQMPDPRLLAFDPSQALEGAKGVMQLANAFEARKGAKAQREALQFQTEQARITAPLILRDLQARVAAGELSLDEAKALAPAKIAAAQAQFGAQAKLAMPEANLRLGQIGAAEKLLPGQTRNEVLKQVLEGRGVVSGIENFDEAEKTKRETARAELDFTKAKTAEANATAERYRAMAQASMAEPSKMDEEFAKGIGRAAIALGIQPSQMLAAIASDAVNGDGIPVSTELSAFAQNIQSATNAIDVNIALKNLSQEAKAALGRRSGSQAAKGSPAATSAAPAGGVPTIKVDKNLKITTPKAAAFKPDPSGNIDLSKQPSVANPDGGRSTVYSRSYNIDGKEVLLPSVTPDGRFLKTDKEVIDQYRKTGNVLGVFNTPAEADAYAEKLHQAYESGEITPAPSAAEEAAFTDRGAAAPAASSGSSVLPGLATIGGSGALYALTNPKIQAAIQSAPANLAKAAKNAWVGREAGRFTGQGISNQLSRLGKSPIKLGAGPAVLAATLGNEAIPMVLNTRLGEALIGKRGTDRSTEDLTVAEGVAKALTQDSFKEMVATAKYDEALDLIDRIRSSDKLSDQQKEDNIAALLSHIRTIDIGR